eukprot:scaffold1788_cov331-Pavlova_lutheri.AAC.1
MYVLSSSSSTISVCPPSPSRRISCSRSPSPFRASLRVLSDAVIAFARASSCSWRARTEGSFAMAS